MSNIASFKWKRIYRTFFIGQYFLLNTGLDENRLRDWTLQSNPVNIMIYNCKELIFRPLSPSSLFPQITPEPTTLSISVVFTCVYVSYKLINSIADISQ